MCEWIILLNKIPAINKVSFPTDLAKKIVRLLCEMTSRNT